MRAMALFWRVKKVLRKSKIINPAKKSQASLRNYLRDFDYQIYLAAVLEAWMLTFVAVLVIVITVLFTNRFHFKLSCHGVIIT